MKKFLMLFLLCALVPNHLLKAQTVTLEPEPGFTEYATYYVSSFDLQTGASNFQLFRFRLHSNQYPVFIKIRFSASMVSPALGINNETNIIDLETGTMFLNADMILENQNLSTATTSLFDVNGGSVPLSVSINEIMDLTQFQQLLSAVVTTGRLAQGNYTFQVEVQSGANENDLSITDTENITLSVQSTSYISLESPGGSLADTTLNVIYNTFPLFLWYPQFCAQCNMDIRVAQFKPGIHSSIADAIEDETMIPFDQSEDWKSIGNVTSFQYPVTNARLLEFNKVYVWQVRASLPTTVGTDEILSPVYAFKIGNLGGSTPPAMEVNPVIQMLGQALASGQFNTLFGTGGVLEGYIPNGNFMINGSVADQNTLLTVINQVISQNASITNVSVSE